MSADFDPYYKWLAIRPEERPITHYRLLGLAPSEDDREVISNAADQRVTTLKLFQTGPHSELSQRLLNEVAKAAICLLNPEKKAEYDQTLGRSLVASESKPDPAIELPMVAVNPPNDFTSLLSFGADEHPSVSQLRSRAPVRPRRRTGWIAAILSLLIGAALVATLANRERTAQHRPIAVVSDPVPRSEKLRDEPRPKLRPPKQPEAAVIASQQKPKSPAGKPAVDDVVQKRGMEPPPVEVVRTFQVADSVQLPSLGDGQSVQVAEITDDSPAVEVVNPDGNPLKFEIAKDTDHWIVLNGGNRVARISRQGKSFHFTWEPGVSTDAECLRNVLLRFRAGDEHDVASLRNSEALAWTVVDLDKVSTLIPLEVNLWGLDARKLTVEVVDVRNGPSLYRVDPDSKRAELGKKLRVIMRNEAPYPVFEISPIVSKKGMAIKLAPLMVDEDGDTLPWVTSRHRSMIKKLQREIAAAKDGIANGPSEKQRLSNQISEMRREINDLNRFVIENEIATLRTDLDQTDVAIQAWKSSLPGLTRTLAAMESLGVFGNLVHQKSTIGFRVFYTVGEHEVDVLRSP